MGEGGGGGGGWRLFKIGRPRSRGWKNFSDVDRQGRGGGGLEN